MDPLIKSFLESKVPAYVVVVSLLLGIWALVQTPREEEPQIVVPMIACQKSLKLEFVQIFIRQNARKTSMPKISDLTE